MATAIVMLTASYEVNSTSRWRPLSVRDGVGAHTRFRTPHHFLKLYTQVILFSTVPGLPIPSAFEMHLEHLPWKTQCPPQPLRQLASALVPEGALVTRIRSRPRYYERDQMGFGPYSYSVFAWAGSSPQQLLPADTGTHASIIHLYWSSSVRVGNRKNFITLFLLKFEEQPI